MKSLLSVCLVAGSALIASHSLTHSSDKNVTGSSSFFTCNTNGNAFASLANDSSLTAIFTYTNNNHHLPAALFINAEESGGNKKLYFYIQPVADDAPSATLTTQNNYIGTFTLVTKQLITLFITPQQHQEIMK